MTAAEAKAMVTRMGATEHVASIVATAPPLPLAAVEVWRSARQSALTTITN